MKLYSTRVAAREIASRRACDDVMSVAAREIATHAAAREVSDVMSVAAREIAGHAAAHEGVHAVTS